MEGLFQNTKYFNKRIAFITDKNKKISYKEIYKKSKEIASKINQKSVTIIIAKNHYECFIGYIALIMFGRTSILLDENFSLKFLQNLIKKYRVNYIFASNEHQSKIKDTDIIHQGDEYSISKTNFDLHKKINEKNLLLLTTSGSTQNPKLVRLSKENLFNNTKNIIKYLNINKNHTTITTMPLGYSYGLSILNTHLYKGAKIVINKLSILEKKFWEKIEKNKVNSFGGVPEFYDFLKKIGFKKKNYPSIKYLTQAGGKMSSSTLEYFQSVSKEKKIKFYTMYGQTEASPRMAILNWKMFLKKNGSIGQPLKNYRIELIDKKKKKIRKPNISGEIVFHGKNVSLGYAKNINDLKKGDVNKKTLFTGDLAFRDKGNYYFIVGRKKNFIKLFGKRFDLKEIKSFLNSEGIKARCYSEDNKLKISLYDNLKKKPYIKKLLSKYLNINPNYILIENNTVKNFKDFN